jgi:hypothetical protein
MSIVAGNDALASDFISSSAGAGDSGKVPKLNSLGKLDDTFFHNGLQLLANAGENVTAAKPGYVSPRDGLIYTAHGYKEDSDVSHSLSFTNQYAKICKLDSTYFLILNHSGTTVTVNLVSRTGGTSTNATVTASATSFVDLNDPRASIARISATKFIVFFERSSKVYYRTGSVSGTTITMDTETDASATLTGSATNTGFECDSGWTDNKCILSYWSDSADASDATTLRLWYLTIDTNSITVVQSTSSSSGGGGAFFPTAYWSACVRTLQGIGYALGVYTGTGNELHYLVLALDLGSGSANAYEPKAWASSDIQGDSPKFNLKPYLIAGEDTAQTVVAVVAGESSARYTSIQYIKLGWNQASVQTIETFPWYRNSGTINEVYPVTIIGNENCIMAWYHSDTEGSNHTYLIQRDKILIAPKRTTATYPQTNGGYAYEEAKDQIVIFGGSKCVKVYLPTLFDGIIRATVSAAAAAVIDAGRITGMSGLTAQRKYYLKDGYTTAGDLDTIGTVPIGRSQSTTEMITIIV